MLSARTKEEETKAAMNALFSLAQTPSDMAALAYEQILEAIQPVTYADKKAHYVMGICEKLVSNEEEVPRTVDALTKYPGVGWKSAVLTLWIAYRLAPEICVDVHVARIGKRLGLVRQTIDDPQKVSRELMQIVPPELYGPWNPTMVTFGRRTCFPVQPACSRCPIADLCPQIGVR